YPSAITRSSTTSTPVTERQRFASSAVMTPAPTPMSSSVLVDRSVKSERIAATFRAFARREGMSRIACERSDWCRFTGFLDAAVQHDRLFFRRPLENPSLFCDLAEELGLVGA